MTTDKMDKTGELTGAAILTYSSLRILVSSFLTSIDPSPGTAAVTTATSKATTKTKDGAAKMKRLPTKESKANAAKESGSAPTGERPHLGG